MGGSLSSRELQQNGTPITGYGQVQSSNDDNQNKKSKKTIVLGPNGKKRLSCSNCRKRRKRCDLGYPCESCKKLGIDCNINEEDLRKKRYSSSYVKSLEDHIAYLETNLKTMADKAYPNNTQVLNNMMIGDVISDLIPEGNDITKGKIDLTRSKEGPTLNDPKNDYRIVSTKPLNKSNETTSKKLGKQQYLPEVTKRPFVKGSLYPEGPVTHNPRPKTHSTTSSGSLKSMGSISSSSNSALGTDDVGITTTSAVLNANITTSTDTIDHQQLGTEASSVGVINTLPLKVDKERISDLKTTVIKRPVSSSNDEYNINTDPLILQSLSKFYTWLYPGHFIFVHRESFLYGFFNHSKNNYADSHYCSTELVYAMCAIGSRLSPELQNMSEIYYEQSKTTLLKLVFDERITASITTVQALFCLAFYELGKGCNQLAWYFSGLAIRVGYDMGFQLDPKVWYTDDSKSQLTESELEIRSRIYWGCYIADHFICLMLGRTSTLSVSNSTIPESDELPEVEGTEEFKFIGKHVLQISLPLKNLIILSRIVQVFTSKIFIESDETNLRVDLLITFNSQVFQWRQSLPGFLQWSKKLLKDEDISTDPTISYFWYYYYIVLLTFNKPFLEESEESRNVVIEILDDLETLFNNFNQKFNNFNYATLYQLYACLLAITCLKKLIVILDDDKNIVWKTQLNHFHSIFYTKLSPSYELPGKLQEDVSLEAEQEKQTALNQVNNINYTHDFSLSNEIDDMIKELFGIAYNPSQPL
ncbi:TY1 enhancer activator [Monosporozyma servazzii]